MPTEYNKLVRDRIPEIINAEGRTYQVETLSDDDFRRALLAKVTEEAAEVANAPTEKLAVELADLQEVIDAVMKTYNIDPETVRAIQDQRRLDRGGFDKRIKLLWTD
jgi:predicted house-cleaning noncanonical NTP pyrophosphatase (MazG superfamily)